MPARVAQALLSVSDKSGLVELAKGLVARGVKLLSAGLDEVPMAYKNIVEVMAAQRDLVDIVARFDPRLVKMAPAGEQPED